MVKKPYIYEYFNIFWSPFGFGADNTTKQTTINKTTVSFYL
jgi:hypothetical protein